MKRPASAGRNSRSSATWICHEPKRRPSRPSGSSPHRTYLCRPRRIITAGADTPSARYSATASPGASPRPAMTGARLAPGRSSASISAPARVRQRRREVEVRDALRDPPGPAAGRAHDERHPRGRVEERHLVPEAVLAKELAMVGGEHDHGVVGVTARFEGRQDLADPLVGVAHRREVGAPGPAHLLLGQRPPRRGRTSPAGAPGAIRPSRYALKNPRTPRKHWRACGSTASSRWGAGRLHRTPSVGRASRDYLQLVPTQSPPRSRNKFLARKRFHAQGITRP